MIPSGTMEVILACPACRFDGSSPVTSAANLAIVVMIVLLGAVGGGVVTLMFRFARGERQALEENTLP
ncbi:MAG: hypothetical protein KGS60_09655 [Verrucomicrobia bacterium]|nr:hypothetical protein [Verrucomicrobiota bacterium]